MDGLYDSFCLHTICYLVEHSKTYQIRGIMKIKNEPLDIVCQECSKVYRYSRSNRKGSTRQTCNSCTVMRRRRKVKRMSVEYKGGKCTICGYNKIIDALEFHHIDPSIKSFSISYKGYTRSWKSVKEELDKTILVCANCHREIEAGLHI